MRNAEHTIKFLKMPGGFRYLYDAGDACWIDCLPGHQSAKRFGPLHWRKLPNHWCGSFPNSWRGNIKPIHCKKGGFQCASTGECFKAKFPGSDKRLSRRARRTFRLPPAASSCERPLTMKQQIENAWVKVHGKKDTERLPPFPKTFLRSLDDCGCSDPTNHQVIATDGEVYDTYFPCTHFQ